MSLRLHLCKNHFKLKKTKKKQTGRTGQKSNLLASPVTFHQTKRHNAPPFHFCYVCPDGRHIAMQEPWQRRAIRHPEAVSKKKKKKKKNMNILLNGIAGYVTQDPSSLLQLEGEQEAGSKDLTSGAIEVQEEEKRNTCVKAQFTR